MSAHPFPQTASSLTLPARAKVNISLAVTGRRTDGYHEVCTLLHTVTLADRVSVTIMPGGGDAGGSIEVCCPGWPQLQGPTNLAHRAAAVYLVAARELLPDRGLAVKVVIDKRIPVAAGLAGGSSDAAATLRGLHHLLSPHLRPALPLSRLLEAAASLGSDVPFCLSGGAAWGTGRGDQLKAVSSTLDCSVLLAVPPFGIASRDAYAWWDEDNPGDASRGGAGLAGGEGRAALSGRLDSLDLVSTAVRNDLRPPVARRHPVIGDLIAAIGECGAHAVEMSGSGPAAYGLFGHEAQALQAGDRLRAVFEGLQVLVCRLDPALTAPGEA